MFSLFRKHPLVNLLDEYKDVISSIESLNNQSFAEHRFLAKQELELTLKDMDVLIKQFLETSVTQNELNFLIIRKKVTKVPTVFLFNEYHTLYSESEQYSKDVFPNFEDNVKTSILFSLNKAINGQVVRGFNFQKFYNLYFEEYSKYPFATKESFKRFIKYICQRSTMPVLYINYLTDIKANLRATPSANPKLTINENYYHAY